MGEHSIGRRRAMMFVCDASRPTDWHYTLADVLRRVRIGADVRQDALHRLIGIEPGGPDRWYMAVQAWMIIARQVVQLAEGVGPRGDWDLRVEQIEQLLRARGSLSGCTKAEEFMDWLIQESYE